jgi:glycosyltransferase involved in cell wall biosynthesis
VARLAHALQELGWPSDLACSGAPSPEQARLARKARALGIDVDDSMHLDSSPNVRKNLSDRRALRRKIRKGGYGLVHCHGTWDHFLTAWALGLRREIPLVRSDHKGRTYHSHPADKWFYGRRMADRLLVISDRARFQAVDRVGRFPETVVTVRGAVHHDNYCPDPAPPGTREKYGLAPEDFVIGIVARVQPHRRWELLIEAAVEIKRRCPRVKIVVLGRGSAKERLLDEPTRRLGLQDTVYPLGYLNEGYENALRMFDAGMLLVPGSDGTCRAAMEMAALAKPMVVGKEGVLPEVVIDGKTGFVVPYEAAQLEDAIVALAEMPAEERMKWGRAGRERMKRWFCPEREVEKVIGVYEDLLRS